MYENDDQHGPCRLVISTISVKPWGDVYACCGVGGFTAPLKSGNAFTSRLSVLIQGALGNPLILALALRGPRWFADVLSEKHGWTPPRTVNMCHVCHLILGTPLLAQKLLAEIDKLGEALEIEYDILSQRRVTEGP